MKKTTLFASGLMTLAAALFLMPASVSHADYCPSGWYTNNDGTCSQSYNYNNNYDWYWNHNYNYNYNNNYNYQQTQRNQLQNYINQLNDLLNRLRQQQTSNSYWGYNNSYYYGTVSALTQNPQNIGTTQATLRGAVTFHNSAQATVYFQYGTSVSNLNLETTHIVVTGNNTTTNFQAMVINLAPQTTYYYRSVAVDQNGHTTYGTVYHFTTYNNYSTSYYNYPYTYNYPYYNYNYNSNCADPHGCDYYYNYTRPSVTTDGVTNVGSNSARLRGSANMGSINNGYAFFVYGTNQSAIQNVENNFNSYSDVMTSGDSIRKVGVGSTYGTYSNYYYNLYNLPSGRNIYYSLCVSYTDNNNQSQLACGSTQSFYTSY